MSEKAEILNRLEPFVHGLGKAVLQELREALAAPQPASDEFDVRTILKEIEPGDGSGREVFFKNTADVVQRLTEMCERLEEWERGIRKLAAPQPAQEPVAWIEHEWSGTGLRHLHFEKREPMVRDEVVNPVWTPLYTTPQAPQRTPLTDEQIDVASPANAEHAHYFFEGARFAEAAHGITGGPAA